MLFNLRGIQKMFSFIECFQNVKAITQFQPFLGSLGLIFLRFLQEGKSVGMLFNLWGLQKMFSFIEKVFSKRYSHF